MSIGADLVGLGLPANQAEYFDGVIPANARALGASTLGSFDNHGVLSRALTAASGKLLRIPAGVYAISRASDVSLAIGANTTIEGDGPENTQLVVTTPAGVGTGRRLFDINQNNITIRGLKISFTGSSAGDYLELFQVQGDKSGFVLEDVVLDGGVSVVGSARTWNAYPILLSNTTGYSDVTVRGGKWQNYTYGILKQTAATSAHRRWKFFGVQFFQSFAETLTFNTPNGVFDDILVDGCTARDNLVLTVSGGANPIHFGFAGATNFKLIGCTTSGAGRPAQVEDIATDGVIVGNTLTTTSDEYGILVTDNNLSGVATSPKRLTIANNAIRATVGSVTSTVDGISLVFDGTGTAPAKQAVVVGNTIDGFERGIVSTNEDVTNLITGNVIRNCVTGVRANVALAGVTGNLIADCTNGLSSATAGNWGPFNQFQGTVTNKIVADSGTSKVILNILGVPTSSAGLATGDVWSNSGVLTVV